MKLFLKNILIFLALPFLGFVMLFTIDYDREFAWNFVKGDCGIQGNWIYSRIHEDPRPIDVAFLGSSCTMAGINEEILRDSFQKKTNLDWHFANIGYCRFGRNLTYIILKELLESKTVRHVVLEVRNDENRFSHPIFPYIADNKSVLNAPIFFNHAFFSDIYLASVSRVAYLKAQYFYKKEEYEKSENPYGHVPMIEVADSAHLEVLQQKRLMKANLKDNPILRNMNLRYPRFYLKKMIQLCEEHQVDLLFLYIPSFGEVNFLPKELKTYQSYGEVFIPPAEIFNKKSYWADDTHLNKHGAVVNSCWFTNDFANYLEKTKK